MQAPSGDQRIISRLRELGLVLPTPPTPLGAYVESSHVFYNDGMIQGASTVYTSKLESSLVCIIFYIYLLLDTIHA